MKSYLDLVKQYEKVHRKKSRITVLCIVIAVCLVTAIFGMAEMEIRAQKIRQINEGGNWHVSIKNISKEDAEQIAQQYASKIAVSGWIMSPGKDNSVVLNKEELLIGAGTGDIIKEFGIEVTNGEFPKDASEIAVDSQTCEAMGLKIGESYSFTFPSGRVASLMISGIFERNSALLKSDSGAVLFLPEVLEQYFDQEDYVGAYTIQLKNSLFMKKTIQDIVEEYQITEENYGINHVMMGLAGQDSSGFIMQLYSVALILSFLVLAAGVLMISSSFNMSVTERIQFFGMLRCLGAAKAQVKRFVLKESLRYSYKAIPIGVAAGTVISWGLCAYLKYVNAAYFSDLPLFGISAAGIISGICVGLFSVLLASMSPCQKASKVSPLSAVNANLSQKSAPKVRTNAKTKFFKVENALGISHATASKKNLFLLTGSFAISIVLFLSFSVAVEFLNCAVTTLKPWTPDLSVYSEDYKNVQLDEKICQQINDLDGVKRAYGRMFEYDINTSYAEKQYISNLVSYEKNQFSWSEDFVLEGNMEEIRDGDGVIVIYDGSVDWKLGDTITLELSGEEKQVKIKGILSESPFKAESGELIIICTEKTFRSLIDSDRRYTIIDVQLNGKSSDSTAASIKSLVGDQFKFSDRRLNNQETQSAYLSFAIFLYGFLVVIASITVFNIMNSMNMSITARVKQYGAMRAVGMSGKQIRKMILTEAVVYALSGCSLGIVLGLLLNRELYKMMITYRWGISWTVPFVSLSIIVLLVIVTTLVSVITPSRKIKDMDIIATISAL